MADSTQLSVEDSVVVDDRLVIFSYPQQGLTERNFLLLNFPCSRKSTVYRGCRQAKELPANTSVGVF
jgi:hypothetical protein